MIRVFKLEDPLSLVQLFEKYGLGKNGFLHRSCWSFHTEFGKEVPSPGIYKIDFKTKLNYMNCKAQEGNLLKGEIFPHPALLS